MNNDPQSTTDTQTMCRKRIASPVLWVVAPVSYFLSIYSLGTVHVLRENGLTFPFLLRLPGRYLSAFKRRCGEGGLALVQDAAPADL